MPHESKEIPRLPSLVEALIPIAFLIVVLSVGIIVFEVDPHIPLIFASAVAALVAIKIGVKWKVIQQGVFDGIMLAMQAIIILMIVGMLIGSWVQGGVVPTMIYYGLQILSPQIFLLAACLITAIVALFVGSSWSTVGTMGIAFLGIGEGLGIPTAMAAGAIISGAYLGDKLSPLSDTTNLAPGVTGDTDLFAHIRHMLPVTIPGFVLALIIYAVLGFQFAGGTADIARIDIVVGTISENFTISPILLLAPVFVIFLIVKKVPPIPGLLGGAILGGIFAMIFQGAGLGSIIDTMHYGFEMDSGVELVDDLLSAGGLHGMMWTISLILAALSFGGILEKCGFLKVILQSIINMVRSYGSLSLFTHLTAIFVNLVTADQYLAIVLPGRMYSQAFKDMGAHPKNLSRIVESSGTITSPLIPWNTCGAFMFGALGVSPFVYLPFAFFNTLTPLISIAYGYLGISFAPWTEEDKQKAATE